jgi:hypothetical protein
MAIASWGKKHGWQVLADEGEELITSFQPHQAR